MIVTLIYRHDCFSTDCQDMAQVLSSKKVENSASSVEIPDRYCLATGLKLKYEGLKKPV